LVKYISQYQKFTHTIEGFQTKYAITLGKVLLKLKEHCKRQKQPWENWAANNLTFLKESNRQRYMRIAKYDWTERYSLLGIDRLCNLIPAIEKYAPDILEKEDPIAYIHKKDGISIDPSLIDDQNNSPKVIAMKREIDRFITMEALRKAGANDVVLGLVDELMEMTEDIIFHPVINEVKTTLKKGECPIDNLKLAIINKGCSNNDHECREKIPNLNSRLACTSEALRNATPEQLDLMDMTLLNSLLESIDEVKTKINEKENAL